MGEDEPLVKQFRGMDDLKQLVQYAYKEHASKPFMGTREKVKGEDGKTTFGEYKWKTYEQVGKETHALSRSLIDKDYCPK